MRLRDRTTTPWIVQTTRIFEAAFYRRLAAPEYEFGLEVLDLFERQAIVDPRMPGEPHPAIPYLWLFETPAAIVRLPRLVIVYTIDETRGAVDLWNLYRLG